MLHLDLPALARRTLRNRTPLRILESISSITSITEFFSNNPIISDDEESAIKISRELWDKHYAHRYFNGTLVGISNIFVNRSTIQLDMRPILYQDYLSTDACMERLPGYCPPLALGVHTLLFRGKSLVCMRFSDGRLGTPGGSVDIADIGGPQSAIENAIVREVREETGLEITGRPIHLTGIFLVSNPVHLVFLAAIELDDDIKIDDCKFERTEHEDIVGIELIEISNLAEIKKSENDSLGLCIKAAKSYLNARH